MKRLIVFTSIFLTLSMGLIAFFGFNTNAQEKQMNNVTNNQIYNVLTIYFHDYATWFGDNDYVFDFSNIPDTYDYFIFNFSDNNERILYYGDGYSNELIINTGVGVRLVDRNDLNWEIYFYNDFYFDYFIATSYDNIIGLTNLLNEAYENGYDLALDHVYEYGFTPLDTEYENQGSWPYQLGYYNGVQSVEIIDYDDAYDAGYDKGVMDVFYNGFVNTGWNYKQLKPYELGFYDGVANNTDFSFTGLLTQVFVGLGSLLAINILPGISIGAIIAVPIVFGIIYFIIGKRGGSGD